MATTQGSELPRAASPSPLVTDGSSRWRWTREEYARLDELGFFGDKSVELLSGEIYVLTFNPPHAVGADLARDALAAVLPADYCLRSQSPLDLGRRSQPQPDVAVVPGQIRDYARAHPTSAALVIEVSHATLRHDRVIKAHVYASGGIGEYWLLNVVERQLEIHRAPERHPHRRGRFRYGEVTVVGATGLASPLFAPAVRIAVADLLP